MAEEQEPPQPRDRDSEGVYYMSVEDFERRREPSVPATVGGPTSETKTDSETKTNSETKTKTKTEPKTATKLPGAKGRD